MISRLRSALGFSLGIDSEINIPQAVLADMEQTIFPSAGGFFKGKPEACPGCG